MPVTQEAAEQLLRDNPQLLNSLHLKWTKYIPHQPTAKQMAFLMLPHQEAFYGGAAGGGKALALDTLVPTPNGWTTINDLQPADMVLGSDGKPTVVLAVSPVMRSRPVYEIEFNDGSKVVADAEHRWMTQTDAERTRAFKSTEDYRAARRARRSSRGSGKRPDLALRNMMVRKLKPAAVCGIRTTAEIAATLTVRGGRSNHTVALTDPIYLPPKTLPLDPYVLGVWLGDGTSANGGITSADPFIIRELKLAGFKPKKGVSRYRYGTHGLQSILRRLGLLNNKHVPDLYLRASLEQRLSLLQGLMDTDGNCTEDGSCEFTNTNKQLVDSVAEIVHSLGGRVVVREGNAKLNGRIVGKKWRLKFVLDFPAFRLPRKRCRQRKPTIRAKRLAIVAVRQIKSVPVKCIQVSNYDGMFLVGKAMIPTHNSDALLMAALQYVDIPGYAAVLFRKTLSDLKLPGSLLSRAHAWLGYRGDCWWNAGEHCLTPDTEVLTANGWRNITEVQVADVVASLNTQTREIEYRPVQQVTANFYDGDLFTLYQKAGVSFSCTPNHKILHSTRRLNQLQFTPASELPQQPNIPQGGIWRSPLVSPERVSFTTLKTSGKTISFEIGDWMEFLGWYLSEGSTIPNLNRISIPQYKAAGIAQLNQLFSKVGGNWFRYRESFCLVNKELCDYLTRLGLSKEKRIPREWMFLEPHNLQRLLDGLVAGDGSNKSPTAACFYSTSKGLADDVMEIALRCGWVPSLTKKKPSASQFGDSPIWTVNLRKGKSDTNVFREDIEIVPYRGMVHCLGVPPFHNFMIRHKGRVSWTGNSYYFPTVDAGGNRAVPARIQFGYIGQMGGGLGSLGVKDRYQSAEFQFVGFDELTQFGEEDYTWMFNRLRKPTCPVHKLDSKGRPIYIDDCWWCQTYKSLPVRMRAASNPGNAGHAWVKNRFKIVGVTDEDGETKYIGTNPDAPYIPAFVQDNPFIDNEGYISNLDRMDSVTRDRLKRGDWGVSEDSRFKRQWVRYYSRYGNSYVLGSSGRGKTLSLDRDFQRIFTTVDPAASSKESPGATKIWRTGASWTVIATWGLTNDYHLLWLDNVRAQVETPDIILLLMDNYRLWRPSKIIIEASGLGKGVFQSALRAGLPAQSVHPHGDKLVRATDAMVRMEQGRVWLPEHPGPAWLEPLESELFTWTGDPMMTDDQIDVLSYAALDISWEAAAMELPLVQESYGVLTDDYRPRIIPEAKFFGSFPGIGYSDPGIDNW